MLGKRLADLRSAMLPADDLEALSDDDRLEVLHEIELLTRTAAGLGVRLQVDFLACQMQTQLAQGVRRADAGKAVADDLALVRMTSPYWGSRELTCSKALVLEMPRTLTSLEAGVISAYQARVITELTSCLSKEDRAEVDRRLEDLLPGISFAELKKAVRALVYEIDPAGYVERARKAAEDRGVSLRAAPDVMGILSARLPAHQAVAAYQSIKAAAESKKASGDPRTLAQLVADELYERLTGRSVVDGIDVEIGLVITDAALFGGTSDPADLLGFGPIPAETARELLRSEGLANDEHSGDADAGDEAAGGIDEELCSCADAVDDTDDASDADDDHRTGSGDQAEDPPAGHRLKELAEYGYDTEAELQRSRDDAVANSAGYLGGRVPEGFCPRGQTCCDFGCTLRHGHPDTLASTSCTRELPAPGPITRPGPFSTPDLAPTPDVAPRPEPAPPRPEGASRPSPAPHPTSPDQPATAPPVSPGVAKAAKVWIRRLFTDPVSGILVARDPRKRLFTGSLRAFLVARDQTCRNAWCGAPIRAVDHIRRHRDGGPTDESNAQGLCLRCNLSREHPRHIEQGPESFRPPPPLLPIFPRVPGGP